MSVDSGPNTVAQSRLTRATDAFVTHSVTYAPIAAVNGAEAPLTQPSSATQR
jgi:hypothetical protein